MKVEFHVETARELNAAVAYYNELRPGLGDTLRAEVYAAIERVIQQPLHFAVVERDIRRGFVRRFPYSILFRLVRPGLLRILVIRHHRRHPRYGLMRR